MAPKYKLSYFTIKGLGEPIRYLLSYGNIEFEDVRYDFDTWTSSVKKTTPFGKLPVLEIDGKVLTQSKATCRYLAREVGLTGKDDWENLQIDIMVETIDDLLYAVADYNYDFDEKSKAAKKGPLLNETLPFYMKKFDTIAGENNGYLANKSLTWADIYFVAVTEHMSFMLEEDVFDPYPNLKALKETIQEIPNIKKYIEQRPADIQVFISSNYSASKE